MDYSDPLPAFTCSVAFASDWRFWPGRHAAHLLPVSGQTQQVDLGRGPGHSNADCDQPVLGQGKLALGPNIVALVMPGNFVMGAIVNNIWSVAGSGSRRDINQMLLQYSINYNMKKGWYVTTQPIVTANWNTPAPSGSVWTVPFGGGVGRVMKLGFQPVNINVQAYGNAVHVPGASSWGVRGQFTLLFPKLTKQQQKMMLQKKLKEMEAAPPN